jgi:hypothetical protein
MQWGGGAARSAVTEGRASGLDASSFTVVILGLDPRIGGQVRRPGRPAICDGRLDPRVKPEDDGAEAAR